MNLANTELTTADQAAIRQNLQYAISAGIRMIPVSLPDIYWLDRLTIYEFWLLRYLDPDNYSQLEHQVSMEDALRMDRRWSWDADHDTVITDQDVNKEAAFPSLSVVLQAMGRPMTVTTVDPDAHIPVDHHSPEDLDLRLDTSCKFEPDSTGMTPSGSQFLDLLRSTECSTAEPKPLELPTLEPTINQLLQAVDVQQARLQTALQSSQDPQDPLIAAQTNQLQRVVETAIHRLEIEQKNSPDESLRLKLAELRDITIQAPLTDHTDTTQAWSQVSDSVVTDFNPRDEVIAVPVAITGGPQVTAIADHTVIADAPVVEPSLWPFVLILFFVISFTLAWIMRRPAARKVGRVIPVGVDLDDKNTRDFVRETLDTSRDDYRQSLDHLKSRLPTS